jgi:DNA-binding GntR family transcriptional regulator
MKASVYSAVASNGLAGGRSSRFTAARRHAEPKPTTAEKVEAAVIGDIREQVYPPGTSLREERMAARYGASRTIIRTVLVRLAAEGYVELHPWRGAYITRYSYEELADLLDLHILLMSFVVRRAAVRRSEDDLARLEDGLRRLEAVAGGKDCSGFHLERIAWLEALLQASSPLDRALKRAAMATFFYHQHWLADIADRDARTRQVAYYRKTLAALADSDPFAAAERLTALLQDARHAVLQAERDAL